MQPLFLSPHYDDVALSCGGTIAALVDSGAHPLIVVCFGGQPTGTLSDFARFQHERWGVGLQDAIAERRKEEACSAEVLGVQWRWLDFLEAIYRGERYTTDEQLFGPIHHDEVDLPEQVCASIHTLIDVSGTPLPHIFVPLGAGNHVDHQHIRMVGQRLAKAGMTVWAYEDFPYAGDPQQQWAVEQLVRSVAAGPPDLRPLTPEHLDRRVRATLCYRSQLPIIFRHQGDPAESIRRYAEAVGEGQPAERSWPLAITY